MSEFNSENKGMNVSEEQIEYEKRMLTPNLGVKDEEKKAKEFKKMAYKLFLDLARIKEEKELQDKITIPEEVLGRHKIEVKYDSDYKKSGGKPKSKECKNIWVNFGEWWKTAQDNKYFLTDDSSNSIVKQEFISSLEREVNGKVYEVTTKDGDVESTNLEIINKEGVYQNQSPQSNSNKKQFKITDAIVKFIDTHQKCNVCNQKMNNKLRVSNNNKRCLILKCDNRKCRNYRIIAMSKKK